MKRQSFEKFYLSKMALGEGCGCAELVSRTRDVEDSYRSSAARPTRSLSLGRLFRSLGLRRRKRPVD